MTDRVVRTLKRYAVFLIYNYQSGDPIGKYLKICDWEQDKSTFIKCCVDESEIVSKERTPQLSAAVSFPPHMKNFIDVIAARSGLLETGPGATPVRLRWM
jgi:hypothetical protein